MALYLGSGEKLLININNIKYCLNVFAEIPITNGVGLLSSEGYMLKDSNGLYLTTKEDE